MTTTTLLQHLDTGEEKDPSEDFPDLHSFEHSSPVTTQPQGETSMSTSRKVKKRQRQDPADVLIHWRVASVGGGRGAVVEDVEVVAEQVVVAGLWTGGLED